MIDILNITKIEETIQEEPIYHISNTTESLIRISNLTDRENRRSTNYIDTSEIGET